MPPATDRCERVRKAGLKPKPELGIQFGAGGSTAAAALAAEGTRDAQWVISRARACRSAGAALVMIESEGITENVTRWRTEVVAEIVEALGIERVMFERPTRLCSSGTSRITVPM